MRSSTSSSDPSLRALVIAAAAFLCLSGGGCWGVRHVTALGFADRRAPSVEYPDGSWYPALQGEDEYVLFHGVGPSIAHARRADIMILGNSRTQFAFPSPALRAFEARHGVLVFSMGFPFAESYLFPLQIIRKFDLRPRIVIVNVDGFFADDESPFARKVRTDGRWAAMRVLFESRVSALVAPLWSRVFPSFVEPPSSFYLLRSSTHGAWLPMNWPHRDKTCREPVDRGTLHRWRRSALLFKEEMARRRARIVLTCIPSTAAECTPEIARQIAALLHVAAVVPSVGALSTGDGSHLCPGSARRYARAFLADLEQLDEMRAISRHDGTAPARTPHRRAMLGGAPGAR
jgi:hypothetical protein